MHACMICWVQVSIGINGGECLSMQGTVQVPSVCNPWIKCSELQLDEPRSSTVWGCCCPSVR